MADPVLLRDRDGPVVVLTLNRPDRRNALGRELVATLIDAIDAEAADHATRAVVIAATGSVFCAGMDLKEAAADTAGSPEAEVAAVADVRAIADLIDRVHRLPKPTVAAVQGDALAGGAGLAIACDLMVMAESARLGYPEVRRGLVAAVVLHDLARAAGDRRARQLLLTGEPIEAATAVDWGLAHSSTTVDSARATAVALARRIAGGGPEALATTKRLLDESAGRPPDLRGAAAVSAAARASAEAAEGMRAFLEKRPPAWAAGAGAG